MRIAVFAALVLVLARTSAAEEINSLPEFYSSTGFGTIAFNEDAANAYEAQKRFKRYNPITTGRLDELTDQATNCYVFNHHSVVHKGRISFIYIRIEKYSSDAFAYNLRIQRNGGWKADRSAEEVMPIDKTFAGETAGDFEATHGAKCKDGEPRLSCEKRLLDEIEAIFGEIHGRTDVGGDRTFEYRHAYTMGAEIPKRVLVDHLFHRFTVTGSRTSKRMPAFCHNNSFPRIRITTFSPLGHGFIHQFEIVRD